MNFGTVLRIVWLFVLLLDILPSTCIGAVTCRNNSNMAVDWFIVYKLPKISSSSITNIKNGVGQVYMDANNQQWKLSDIPINQIGNHAVYNTLQQIYDNGSSQNVAYLMYNDEPADGIATGTKGHTKGDIAFDVTSGFWLVHSVPKFPPGPPSSYAYPSTGHEYGQSLLCVTYNYTQFNTIGLQLKYNDPDIYNSSIPDSFSGIDNIRDVLKGVHPPKNKTNNVNLESSAGQQFSSFAKYKSWKQDLYTALVAPYFTSNLYTETWLNGRGPLPSNCTAQYKVWNINNIMIEQIQFEDTKDHSKWAVTTDSSSSNRLLFRSHAYRSRSTKTIICIGDINREQGQLKRSGGTVCANLPSVWKAFTDIITGKDSCK